MARIPNILHYCFGLAADFGGKPWSLVHYVCVASAIRHLRPEEVFFYYEYEPQGPWWDLTRQMVTPIRIKAPAEIFGRPLLHPAHQADVVRLSKLIEIGGIYLDADVLVHRSFDDLRDHSTVLGREGSGNDSGLANAIILAESGAPFLRRWYQEYSWFRGKSFTEHWQEHSVEVPKKLAEEHPAELTILPPTAFYWPLWTNPHIKWIFDSSDPIPDNHAYATHLWESVAWKYLEHLTPGQVRASDTNFHRWARPYVQGLPDHLGRAPLHQRITKQARRASRAAKWHFSRVTRRLGSAKGVGRAATRGTVTTRAETFENIYKSGLWGHESGSDFFSGVGSRGPAVDQYVRNMVELLGQHQKELDRPITVVDVGCGDFQVGRALTAALPELRYIGCDIVAPLIEHHGRVYGSDTVGFHKIDVVTERPPRGDVCLIRQVFQHLSNADIGQALKNLDGFHAIYVTEGQPEVLSGPVNPDKSVGEGVRFDWQRGIGRGVELGLPPFNCRTEEVFRAHAPPHETIVTSRVIP